MLHLNLFLCGTLMSMNKLGGEIYLALCFCSHIKGAELFNEASVPFKLFSCSQRRYHFKTLRNGSIQFIENGM